MAKQADPKQDEIKELQNQIKKIQKDQKQYEKNLQDAEKDLNFASYKIAKKGKAKTTEIQGFIKVAQTANNPLSTPEQKGEAGAEVTKRCDACSDLNTLIEPCKEYCEAQYNIDKSNAEVTALQAKITKLQNKTETVEYEELPIPSQEGHLYPVALVTEWTNKLNFYNAMLDDFIKKIEKLDPLKIDITWLMKKCEWVCRKINYALAMLRYTIIKCLNKIFNQVKDMVPIVGVIANASPSANPAALLAPVKGVVDVYMKPYDTAITFLSDFMTYTPPLVEAAAKLAAKASTVPVKLLSKIDLVVKDQADGKQKEIAEVYKQYINIKFEPITLGDVMSGNVEKPAMAAFSGNKKLYDLQKSKLDAVRDKMDLWEDNFKKTLKESYKDSLPLIEKRAPEQCSVLKKDQHKEYFFVKEMTIKEQDETAGIVYEIGKMREKAQEAKQKAIEKAQKAQKIAERNQILAAKDILNDEHIAEAEKAKADADKALQEANNISTEVAIPWGKSFNTTRYPVEPIITTKTFVDYVTNKESNVLDMVKTYYACAYGKVGSKRQEQKALEYVGWICVFGQAYSFIEPELDKYKDLVIEYYEIKNEIDKLNRRSIFK